jgi:hypothetical protein
MFMSSGSIWILESDGVGDMVWLWEWAGWGGVRVYYAQMATFFYSYIVSHPLSKVGVDRC